MSTITFAIEELIAHKEAGVGVSYIPPCIVDPSKFPYQELYSQKQGDSITNTLFATA